MHELRTLARLCSLAVLVSACSSDDGSSGTTATDGGAGAGGTGSGGGGAGAEGGSAGAPSITEPADFVTGGSIRQVWVTDASEGDELVLFDAEGHEVARGTADRLGSLIFRGVAPGDGYTVRRIEGDEVYGTEPFTVLSEDDTPDVSLYDQELDVGLNYVVVRDGIELAVTVRLPLNMTLADGPFPTVIEYSGYQVAAPGNLLEGALNNGGLTGLNDPLLPATSTAVGSIVAPLLGYAAVSVQMRGSGCSGGDFQLFDLPTTYDGYDVVEIVGRQPWVKDGKVGLVGISFSGISQFFVAGTRPPHLAAITPMSVTDDIYSGTGFPGGIFNNGFAASWLHERQDNAAPAPESGAQPYAVALVESGDQHCIDNQKLRLQTQDIDTLISENPFRDPDLIEHRSPASWAANIDVPVFLVGQFHDEQTGGHFPQMLGELAGNPDVWITLQNGAHVDSLGPGTITRWAEFLDLFVAGRIPSIPAEVTALSTVLYQQIAAGAPSMPLPATRFDAFGPSDVPGALAAFRDDPRVRLMFDVGAGPLGPGAFETVWELGFDAWPVAEAQPVEYFLGDGGALAISATGLSGEVSYVGNPGARPAVSLPTGDPWAAAPPYDWTPVVDGAALGFVTAPLTADVVIAGASSLDLMLQSSAADTDLQVTISDVRPDGGVRPPQEMYVQAGWLRASHRSVDASRSTATNPVQLHLEEDAADLPASTFELVRVQIHPVAYAFRAGHQIRVTIQAPGGDRPSWRFQTVEDGTIENTVQLGASKLVLPVVTGAAAGAPLPACPSNRGQPCRAYAAASNGG